MQWRHVEGRENEVSAIILDICIRLHKKYGPGLLKSVYEELLCYELMKRDVLVERQKPIPLIHDGIRLEAGFRASLMIDERVIVEIISTKELEESLNKQVLTCLKLTGLKLGLLISFNEDLLKSGFHRIVNGL